jgi:hypothetical protein
MTALRAMTGYRHFVIEPRSGKVILSSPAGLDFRGSLVHRLTQGLARLEMRDAFFRDVHAFARTRIAAHPGRTAVDGKAAEPTNLDAVTAHQRLAHRVKNGLDRVLGVAMRELAEAGSQFFDKITAGHDARFARMTSPPRGIDDK